MIKKICIGVLSWLLITINFVYGEAPKINCFWLPGCVDKNKATPSSATVSNNVWVELITNIIWQAIMFVAVIAVIALIISWIMYLISWWEEEKTKKAKIWIIWSLAGVFLSISAWFIINLLNNLKIW